MTVMLSRIKLIVEVMVPSEKMRLGKLISYIFIVTVISLILLLAIELLLRFIYSEELKPDPSTYAYQYNKDYLVSLKPNIKKTFKRHQANGGQLIHWETNSEGFRGKELQQSPNKRVVVYGDSNIQARFSSLENTFVYKLGRFLSREKRYNVETVNAGVVGFGPDQSLIRFSNERNNLKPDLVIFHLFADNDFGDLIRNRLFRLDRNAVVKKEGFKVTVDQQLKPPLQFMIGKMAIKVSKKLSRMIESFRGGESDSKQTYQERMISRFQVINDKEFEVYQSFKPRSVSHFADHYDLDVALTPSVESSVVKKELMAQILLKAKQEAESHGVKFMVMIQPSVIDLTQNFLISFKDFGKIETYHPNNISNALARICVENKIDYLNLFDVFSDNKPASLFFRAKDSHWNDKGQDLAAHEMAAYILEHHLL